MLERIWTAFLLALAGVSAIAWLVALMDEKGIHSVQALMAFFKKRSKTGRVVVGALFIGFLVFASVKPGDGGGNGGGGDGGGTNNVQMVVGPGGGSGNVANVEVLPIPSTNAQSEGSAQLGNGNIGTGNNITMATLITSTNTTRTLTGDDFRRGFVLARVGTGEQFDFSAPSDAVVCADWRAFGAAEDWFYVAFTNWAFRVGTNEIDRLRVHSDGWLETGTTGILPVERAATFWPLHAVLGIVPEANWHLLTDATGGTPVVPVNGQDARSPSLFWHYITPSNTLQVTWQNALLDRDTDTPVSFQAEFWTDGRFDFRYDLSRCGGRGATALPDGVITNLLVGASFAGNSWATNSLPTNVTSMAFCPLAAEDAYNPDADGAVSPALL